MEFIEQILGRELNLPARFLIAFVLVLILIAISAWIVRRIADRRVGGGRSGRGRQQRLAVMDWAVVDARRRLVLIRRDHVEHLMLVGGPTDVVVETNIVRPGSAVGQSAAAGSSALPPDVTTLDALVTPPTPAPQPEEPGTPAPAKAGSGLKLDDMAQRLESALQRPGAARAMPPPTSGRTASPAPRGNQEIGQLSPGAPASRSRPASAQTERPAARPSRLGVQSAVTAHTGRATPPPQRANTASQPPRPVAGKTVSTGAAAGQPAPTPAEKTPPPQTAAKGNDGAENGDAFIPEIDFLGIDTSKPSDDAAGDTQDQPKSAADDRASLYHKLVRKDG